MSYVVQIYTLDSYIKLEVFWVACQASGVSSAGWSDPREPYQGHYVQRKVPADQLRRQAQGKKKKNGRATSAEQAKRRKYENLDSSFIFVPFGVESLGLWVPEARALFKELSKRVIEPSGDPRAGSYLGQRISLAIQRGNAASILGTVPRCGGFEVLDFI
ncbi:jg21227 [Pararge aegeria aegeria]|uniref:Jg21227 protein n=1 Tax=Pararge aegeria aegeria TaxID=348720 RepID=A0A8S4R4B5_9NEOP|nr:jg21227 [Pararge aegeria aegeria]